MHRNCMIKNLLVLLSLTNEWQSYVHQYLNLKICDINRNNTHMAEDNDDDNIHMVTMLLIYMYG